ncbi:MAG TPA: hypothetical protein P5121_39315 [Caldilineaceae bacterium]|nr:hypothetical protein [Caldilineaceae bacterium]
MSEEQRLGAQEASSSEKVEPTGNSSAGGPGHTTPSRTPIEQAADLARAQATAAADAFRRGEFMHDAAQDPGANGDDRLIALLTYATQAFIPFIMPILVLLSESSKLRPFQRFHAVQSLALTCIVVATGVLVSISTAVVQIIPPLGMVVGIAVFCMTPIVYLMYLVALFYYGYQAYQGKRFAIPGLTSFLRDQGWL